MARARLLCSVLIPPRLGHGRPLKRLLGGRELCPRRRQVSGGGYLVGFFGRFLRASISACSSAVSTSHTD